MNTMNGMNIQTGGMKIIVKNDRGRDTTIRKIKDKRDFISIFSNTVRVEVVSVDSLTGFILRITLPADSTPFRSDIFNESGELMNADEYQLPNTGQIVTEHILKFSIVQADSRNRVEKFNSVVRKGTCTSNELTREYTAQSYLYDATMAYGGMPVCPDAYAIMEFNLAEFREIFFPDTLSPRHVGLPPITTNIFRENAVFRYLLRQMELDSSRSVGIIVMESLPPSYQTVKSLYSTFYKISSPSAMSPALLQNKLLFNEMTERILSICVIVFYRTGCIPLDAHLGNWMYDTTQSLEQFKIRAIDFGKVISFRGKQGIDTIMNYIRVYIRVLSNNSMTYKNLIIKKFARILNIPLSKMHTAELCGTMIGEIFTKLIKTIRRNMNGHLLWHPTGATFQVVTKDATSRSPAETMEVDSCMILIHKILFLISLVDGCFNSITYDNHHFCQLRDSLSYVFGLKCNNLESMIGNNVYIDLVSYLTSMSNYSKRIEAIQSYARIRDYIGNYLHVSSERGLFPDPYYEDASPDTPHNPSLLTARYIAPPPPPPPPPPSRRSPKKGINVDMMGDEYEDYISGKYSTLPNLPTVKKGGRIKKIRKSIQPRKRVTFTLSKKCKTRKPIKTRKNKKNKSRRKYTL